MARDLPLTIRRSLPRYLPFPYPNENGNYPILNSEVGIGRSWRSFIGLLLRYT